MGLGVDRTLRIADDIAQRLGSAQCNMHYLAEHAL